VVSNGDSHNFSATAYYNTTNYKYIRAENAAGLGPWSNAIPFRTVGQTTLTVGTPAGATLPLTWSLLGTGADVAYELEYATDAGFTTGTGTVSIAGGTTSYNFTMTTPGTTYYFRMRGKWTSSGPPVTDVYGIYSSVVSHLYSAGTPAAEFFKLENDTGTTIDLVLDFSTLDSTQYDELVGSIQVQLDGIVITSYDNTTVMNPDESFAYGAYLGGDSSFAYDGTSDNIVMAWASNPADVRLGTLAAQETFFNMKFWQSDSVAKFRFNYSSKSSDVTFNTSYDTFVQAPTDLALGIRKYNIQDSGILPYSAI
jgi:hypothetical protein